MLILHTHVYYIQLTHICMYTYMYIYSYIYLMQLDCEETEREIVGGGGRCWPEKLWKGRLNYQYNLGRMKKLQAGRDWNAREKIKSPARFSQKQEWLRFEEQVTGLALGRREKTSFETVGEDTRVDIAIKTQRWEGRRFKGSLHVA